MSSNSHTSTLTRTGLAAILVALDVPGEIQLPNGSVLIVGNGEPVYRVTFRTLKSLRTRMTELGIGRAYVAGDIEIDGDIAALFNPRHRLRGGGKCCSSSSIAFGPSPR